MLMFWGEDPDRFLEISNLVLFAPLAASGWS